MEIFELEFRGKRLRAYLDDCLQTFFNFEDLRPIVGAGDPFKVFGAELVEVPEEGREVLVVFESEILSRPVFRATCPDFWNWFVGDGLMEIRIHVADSHFREGASESGQRFLQCENQILEENLKDARDRVAELEKMIADLRSEKLSLQDRYTKALQEQKTLLSELLDIRQGR